ncbi:MAG TPA: acyltransferase domain-containing protein, partial [Solirubrobacteraceae bacterium]|nr:acyltransferase domain-containing protein [Solirubrobacteraceae bacterium]
MALHLACGALRGGECELALAGGATVLGVPNLFVEFSRQRALAADGRARPYAESANGTSWAEGVGILALERLSDARRHDHRVLATILASAVNQDGESNGLTAPSGIAQQRVIRQALSSAGLSPSEVDAVEGHGTGTRLGDPIEAQALLATYGRERPRDRPLWLGSIKSNIGHAQAAAGVGGVIKMVMAMRHGMLPKTLHLDEPSTHVDWSQGGVSLLSEQVPWSSAAHPRRAGVSSFGMSGTNAHLIIEEEAGQAPGEPQAQSSDGPLCADASVWLLSARDPLALRAQAERLEAHLNSVPALTPEAVGRALARRPVFAHRAALLGRSREALLLELHAVTQGDRVADVLKGVSHGTGQVVFVFPGQGAQWTGMAIELLDRSPAFGELIAQCEDALAPYVDWGLADVLRGGPQAPPIDRVDILQPTLFAIMVSLARMWERCGVHPDAVVGHSQGEIAAAHVAGGLSLKDASRVIAMRGKALAALAGLGGMVSVALGLDALKGLLEELQCELSVAAVNGPGAVVLSGEPAALKELLGACEREHVTARAIPVDYAAHSQHVEEIRAELLSGCEGISPRSGSVPFYSATLGGVLDTARLDADYWYRNLRETVQFERVTQLLVEQGYRAFIEMSPHSVLTVAVEESVEATLVQVDNEDSIEPPTGDPGAPVAVASLGSLRRGDGGPERLLRSLCEAWVRGVEVDWSGLLGSSAAQLPDLPTYAFQRKRYWLDGHGVASADVRGAGLTSVDHPLLGSALSIAGGESWLFTGRISLQTQPWLADHAVMGSVVLPGALLLELALYAGQWLGCEHVRELTLQAPLVLAEDGAVQLQVSVGVPEDDGSRSIEVHARAEDPSDQSSSDQSFATEQSWTRHALGSLTTVPDIGAEQGQRDRLEERLQLLAGAWPIDGAKAIEPDVLYGALADRGLQYGPVFQGVQAAWLHGRDVIAEVAIAGEDHGDCEHFAIHPALLDAALHGTAAAGEPPESAREGVQLPFSISGVQLHARGARRLRVLLSPHGERAISLLACDEQGNPMVAIESLVMRPISAKQLAAPRARQADSLFEIGWTQLDLEAGRVEGDWAILGEDSPIRERLRAAGPRVSAHADMPALIQALPDGGPAPAVVLAGCPTSDPGSTLADAVSSSVKHALALAQEWLSETRLSDSCLVFLTRDAVPVEADGEVAGLLDSGVWGLVRSAQSEHPGRFLLLDIDERESTSESLAAAIACALQSQESQLAIRDGVARVPRTLRAGSQALAVPQGASEWRLDGGGAGTLDGLKLIACPEVAAALQPGQVRVAMRAAGLNFRDVLSTLGV